MKYIFLFLLSCHVLALSAQTTPYRKSEYISFDDYLKLAQEVKPYREARLVSLKKFNELMAMNDVIVLDTRSDSMYKAKHIKGAIHLNFSDFTEANLAKLIPSKSTTILIYCNNNFVDDQINFPTKSAAPPKLKASLSNIDEKPITLALNIPTFINLYGYGYKNIYELNELVSIWNSNIKFEGTSVSAH